MEGRSCFLNMFSVVLCTANEPCDVVKRMETSETCLLLKSVTGTQLIVICLVVSKYVLLVAIKLLF